MRSACVQHVVAGPLDVARSTGRWGYRLLFVTVPWALKEILRGMGAVPRPPASIYGRACVFQGGEGSIWHLVARPPMGLKTPEMTGAAGSACSQDH